jgi:anti-sigma B factor antagonist
MEFSEESAGDVTVVSVAGRLDTETAGRFGTRLTELLRAGHSKLLIEASRLNYISSAGFRALIIAAKDAAAKGARLAVCSMTPPTRQLVEVAGLEQVFETYPSREEAMRVIANSMKVTGSTSSPR